LSRFLQLLCPAEFVESVHSVDVSALMDRGIKALLVDLDNTLVRWQGYDVSSEVTEWLHKTREQGMKVCIVSNTHSTGRLNSLASKLGLPCARRALKPRRRGFREALGLLNAGAAETAVIGDQIFTDILGGNRLGLHTILVRPLHAREFIGTKISRLFERMLIGLLLRRGMLRPFGAGFRASGEQSAAESRQMNTEN
jgi:uncharacterized protein